MVSPKVIAELILLGGVSPSDLLQNDKAEK